jgi:molybdopterin-binding protein
MGIRQSLRRFSANDTQWKRAGRGEVSLCPTSFQPPLILGGRVDSVRIRRDDKAPPGEFDKERKTMEISARNQLKGTVKAVVRGAVLGEVVVDIGGQEVVSSITLSSIDRLRLKVGDPVFVIVKATDVMIGK